MTKNIKKPNFFIIGAPKCGTTAIAQYLGKHPDIFFSEPKEPCFFCTDFPKERDFTNEDDYLNSCFSQSVGYSTVGEGSPIYLFSKEAVPNILEFNPKAKFIVIVRQPVDLFLSTFYQMKLSQRETASDPEKAWNLQKRRRFGKINQSERLNSKNLSYGDFCKLGEQIERLYQNTQGKQVKLIFFDDFKNNTKKVYEEILEFLEIPSDGRVYFPVVNKRKKIRSNVLMKVVKGAGELKRKAGIQKSLGILGAIKDKNIKRIDPEPIPDDFKKELLEYFDEDIDKLAELTGRDLSHWKEI